MSTASGATEPARLGDADLLRLWAAGLARGAERPDVRKLAGGLLVVLDESEALRRAGRETMVPAKVREMLLGGLRARGAVPPVA